MDSTVKIIEEVAPVLEDSILILILRQLVVDVIEPDGLGIIFILHPADPILRHLPIGDRLLCGDLLLFCLLSCRIPSFPQHCISRTGPYHCRCWMCSFLGNCFLFLGSLSCRLFLCCLLCSLRSFLPRLFLTAGGSPVHPRAAARPEMRGIVLKIYVVVLRPIRPIIQDDRIFFSCHMMPVIGVSFSSHAFLPLSSVWSLPLFLPSHRYSLSHTAGLPAFSA